MMHLKHVLLACLLFLLASCSVSESPSRTLTINVGSPNLSAKIDAATSTILTSHNFKNVSEERTAQSYKVIGKGMNDKVFVIVDGNKQLLKVTVLSSGDTWSNEADGLFNELNISLSAAAGHAVDAGPVRGFKLRIGDPKSP